MHSATALAILLSLAVAQPVVAAGAAEPADSEQFGLLSGAANALARELLPPVGREPVAGFMIETLRGSEASGRAAIIACETRSAELRPGDGPEWQWALVRTWACAREREADGGAALVQTTIRAVMQRFDPGGYYYPDVRALTSGDVENPGGGTGLVLKLDDDGIAIRGLARGSPAARAGIRRGDRLIAIDGIPVGNLPLAQVQLRLLGAPDSEVVVAVSRASLAAPLERRLRRASLRTGEVTLVVRGGVAIAVIEWMGRSTAEGLGRRLIQLLEGGERPTAIILDLRGSEGGLLDTVRLLADLFVERGVLGSIEHGRTPPERWSARRGDVAQGLPLYLLVDNTTASGAEALAAALADTGRARVVGERTMGVGDVRTFVPLGSNQALAITTGRLVRPNGEPVSAGVTPDIAIEMGDGPPAGDDDPALDRAIEAIRADLARRPPAR